MEEYKYNHLFKLILVGDQCVGKSSLLSRFADGSYEPRYISTIGVNFNFKTIVEDDLVLRLQCWDTAGDPKFQTITKSYYNGADGFVIVFDLTKFESFESLTKWVTEIENGSRNKNFTGIIVGMKSELVSSRAVSHSLAQEFASKRGLMYVEASAVTGENVDKAFTDLAGVLLQKCNPSPQKLHKEVKQPDPEQIADTGLGCWSKSSQMLKMMFTQCFLAPENPN
jgi:Ras-related protein Rab-1A